MANPWEWKKLRGLFMKNTVGESSDSGPSGVMRYVAWKIPKTNFGGREFAFRDSSNDSCCVDFFHAMFDDTLNRGPSVFT